jgi:hypothetical protein
VPLDAHPEDVSALLNHTVVHKLLEGRFAQLRRRFGCKRRGSNPLL